MPGPRPGSRRARPTPATARLRALSRLSALAVERGLTTEEHRELLTYSESEEQWRRRARKLAQLAGFRLVYHTHRSKKSDPGFPDEVWLRETDGRLLFVETKRIDGQPTLDQWLWLETLWSNGHEAFCLWPDERDLLEWILAHPHAVRQSCLDARRAMLSNRNALA